MKTSNYILIALFVFVTVSLLVLFISARGHENGEGRFNFTQKEYPLDNIKVIVAEPGVFIHIRTSENNSLIVHYPIDEKEPVNAYRISSDTLFVSKVIYQNEKINPAIDVYVGHLSSLVAKSNSNINVDDFTIDKLVINADQAFVGFHNSSIGEAIIQAEHSGISMYSTKVESIFGKLENNSSLRGDSKNIQKIDIEKDQNSQINL